MKRLSLIVLIVGAALALAACFQKTDGPDMANRSYTRVSQYEAQEMMATETGYIILDVRTQREYDSGHIPGAICIPVDQIKAEQPAELPDLDQRIFIYCRSGNRSQQAANKLFDMGYTGIVEFGGINSWTGPVVTTEEESAS